MGFQNLKIETRLSPRNKLSKNVTFYAIYSILHTLAKILHYISQIKSVPKIPFFCLAIIKQQQNNKLHHQ